ncbi:MULTISPECIES: glycosyltransferase [unclassified Streptomyces]|uniref:glycosyltransferase n=1 Tax=unclassified Streptomyces TaxID=2593676 RepID=UPI002365E943|nr:MULTISPECIES: glycosyltransferase [unclassified Streptomyces]MDF3140916.1 glycosyltransferase [Streptomyces sp. T21Q-yed]WDF40539.1 glycosyltransferase [Streptomyces sp. T12]
MRLVHVVTLVSEDGAYGGPTSVATGQLEECAARGHEVTLLSLWRGRAEAPARIGSVPLRTRPARALLPGRFTGIMHPLLVRDMWRSMGRADVVHIHAGRDLVSLAALAVATLRGKRFFTQTHGMVEPRHRLVAKLFDSLYVPLLRRARGCLVLTERERRAVSEVIGPQGPPLLTLPNGVRPERDAAVERRPHAPEVLFMARLHPRKRPEAFVEMAALVHRKLPDARFTLHGPDEGSLPTVRQLIAIHRLGDVVSYGGALSYAEAVRAYAKAAVYVLPSVDEPFPMTVIEAMSAGTPVVCTDTCGMADELARRGAAIVTDGSPQAMADAVCELLTDEDKRHGLVKAGTRAVEEAFSIHAVADRLEELYRNL